MQPVVDSLTPNKNPLDPLMKEMQTLKEQAAKVKESVSKLDVANYSMWYKAFMLMILIRMAWWPTFTVLL